MRTYIIFSNNELADLVNGKPVEDEANHIVYISEEGYEREQERRRQELDERF